MLEQSHAELSGAPDQFGHGRSDVRLLTNCWYADSIRRLRDIVAGIAGLGRTHSLPRELEHCRRSGCPVDEKPRISRVKRRLVD